MGKARKAAVVLLFAATVPWALTGCSNNSGEAEANAAPAHNRHGAPIVTNPLNVDRFARDPCSVLSAQQLRQLTQSIKMAPTGKARPNTAGRTCDYTSMTDFTLQHGSINFITSGSGLTGLYAKRTDFKLFEELPRIEGYPAVIVDLIDARKQGECSISVGVNDRVIANFDLAISDFEDTLQSDEEPCKATLELARAGIRSMKGEA